MKKLFLFVTLLLFTTNLFARGQYFNYVQRGGGTVVTSHSVSSNKVQKSYPGATVTVYIAGTTGLATLYSDSGGTAQANPFTAGSDGSFSFWTDASSFDIKFSGTGITTSCGNSYPGYPCVSAFTWSGLSTIGSSGVTQFSVRDFGAVGNGTTDDTAAFTATWTAAKAAKNTCILIPSGTYLVKSPMPTIYGSDLLCIVGDGFTNSKITYAPTTAGTTFLSVEPSGAATVDRLSIGKFAVFGSGTNAKTLMRVTATGNASEMYDLVLQDTTNSASVALRWEGWNLTTLRDSWLRAKNPLILAKPSAGTLSGTDGSFDHMSIINTTIWSDYSTSYLIDVDSGSPNLPVSSLTISGYSAWLGGKGGMHLAAGNITNIMLSGVRWEGNGTTTAAAGAGYFLDLEPGSVNNGRITLISVRDGVDQLHDIKLRNLTDVAFIDCFIGYGGAWSATEVVLDMDATVDRVYAQNTTFINANFSINSALEKRWATTTIAASYNSYASIFWAQRSASGSQYDLAYEQGVPKYKIVIPSLANNATYTLISTAINNNDPTPGIIFIAAEDVARTSGTSAMGTVFSRWDNTLIAVDALSTLSNASGTANKLNVYRSGANIVLENKLGLAVKIIVLYN